MIDDGGTFSITGGMYIVSIVKYSIVLIIYWVRGYRCGDATLGNYVGSRWGVNHTIKGSLRGLDGDRLRLKILLRRIRNHDFRK
jgi:hypothetical protein